MSWLLQASVIPTLGKLATGINRSQQQQHGRGIRPNNFKTSFTILCTYPERYVLTFELRVQ